MIEVLRRDYARELSAWDPGDPGLRAVLCEGMARAAGYRTGVRCRWLMGDFRHLLEVLRGSPIGYPGKYPGRLKTLINFLLPHPGTYHDNFALRDPLPEVGDWLDFALRRVPGEIKKRKAAREELHVQRGYSHS